MKKTANTITLFLEITKGDNNSHNFRYLSLMDNGTVVNLEGLVISEPTTITVQLTNVTNTSYVITQCLIPAGQCTVTASIEDVEGTITVTLIDSDNEQRPETYNFAIIANNRLTGEQVVCDPQARNKGSKE